MATTFTRRNLMKVPVVSGPRSGTSLLIKNQEFLGTNELTISNDPENFMSAKALGLESGQGSESWWIASHGRWYSQVIWQRERETRE